MNFLLDFGEACRAELASGAASSSVAFNEPRGRENARHTTSSLTSAHWTTSPALPRNRKLAQQTRTPRLTFLRLDAQRVEAKVRDLSRAGDYAKPVP